MNLLLLHWPSSWPAVEKNLDIHLPKFENNLISETLKYLEAIFEAGRIVTFSKSLPMGS